MSRLIKIDSEPINGLADEVAELKGGGMGTMMKFDYAKERFFVSDDEVPLGREFIAHCGSYARGWVKFADKKLVDTKVRKVSEGKPLERNELDDPKLAGTENDPWVFQRYLPLEDLDSGEIIVFVSKSTGGKIALGGLLDTYQHNTHRGLPIIKLCRGTFNTKSFGSKPRPDFKITGWTGNNKITKTITSQTEPPEDLFDPEDPHYVDFMK